ncbi:hypothetical protein LL037_18760 [Clostridium estertheticum]|uniref:hypothetical protein n=1 Tax=Clostridium estertheticum TaxID=238834 RepID=UPI001C0BF176|nr:hypothetical protein [Clostridium estertheticum]MBU3198511.1 hypothetical protein [Clostridium estertheticum]WAG64492.1 hypothetical protein LL037_18760 [Clostridium estertheticum]
MRNKKKSLSLLSIIIFTLYLLTNSTMPVEAITSNLNVHPAAALTLYAVKVSASVNNKTPLQNTVVKVTVNGPAKGSVIIVCNYKSTNTTYKGTIASNGKEVVPVRISRATKEFAVVTNVSVTYKGKMYTAKTSFKPR